MNSLIVSSPPPLPPNASPAILPGQKGSHVPPALPGPSEISTDHVEVLPKQPTSIDPKRIERESLEMYERFRYWCTAPLRGDKRSLADVAETFGLNPKTVSTQAARYNWNARAIEYDRRRLTETSRKAGELQVATAASHLAAAQTLTDQAHAMLQHAQEFVDQGAAPEWVEIAGQVARILEKAQKVARLALGQSESNVSIHVETKQPATLELRDFSDAELDVLRAGDDLRFAATPGPAGDRARARAEARDVVALVEAGRAQPTGSAESRRTVKVCSLINEL